MVTPSGGYWDHEMDNGANGCKRHQRWGSAKKDLENCREVSDCFRKIVLRRWRVRFQAKLWRFYSRWNVAIAALKNTRNYKFCRFEISTLIDEIDYALPLRTLL